MSYKGKGFSSDTTHGIRPYVSRVPPTPHHGGNVLVDNLTHEPWRGLDPGTHEMRAPNATSCTSQTHNIQAYFG